MAEYAESRTGPMASNRIEAGAFAASSPDEAWPALQLVFNSSMPLAYLEAGPNAVHGMGFTCWVNRPCSTGQVTLSSSDPLDRPIIDPNYLAHPEDMRVAMAGVRWNLRILGGSAFEPLRTRSAFPESLQGDDDALRAYIRREGTTIWHVSGTCKMCTDDSAVVDAELRCHGVERLRIVDASVMPHVVSANTNAAVIMIAEKASDMVRGRVPLPKGADA